MSQENSYDRFVSAKRIEVSGVVMGTQCDSCRMLDRACVMSHVSTRCSTCEMFDRVCSNHVETQWNDFLTRLREIQAREALARLELSVLVGRVNTCLNLISDLNAEKSYLLRGHPNTFSGTRLVELESSNS